MHWAVFRRSRTRWHNHPEPLLLSDSEKRGCFSQALDAAAAGAALDAFDEGPWGRKYPAIARSWRRNREQVIPFFACALLVRRMIYTANAIESLNSAVRKAIRNKSHFPSDAAATKLIWAALRHIEAKWKSPPIYWHAAKAQLDIRFEERFILSN